MINLNCLSDIITDNLAIHIDLTKLGSWNLNTGLTSISLTKWSNAVSDDINLIDYGLTEFDNGRINKPYTGITISQNDTKLKLDRVGYNQVKNPTTGETSGFTTTTKYNLHPITGIVVGSGNYFTLNGGYLQGFFKLHDYDFELFPPRYNNGITIETILKINSNSQGIFYMMGVRSEDKYNSYFSGETLSGITTNSNIHYFSGVTTSEGNTFESFTETIHNKKAFAKFEEKDEIIYTEPPQINNISGNVIAFEITSDKNLAYRYVDDSGNLITNTSPNPITATGWTVITISFTPYDLIPDLDLLSCYQRRTGKLIFYVNGRANWIVDNFSEFKFKNISNKRDLQIGVPYSISWGGGSFGLKYSWHYDYQTYVLYGNQNTQYINNNFITESDPFPTACSPYSGGTLLSGMTFTADTVSFHYVDECNVKHQEPVMKITYTGATGNTGSTYFIKYDNPIVVLSNREYEINLDLFNDGFFETFSNIGNPNINKISIALFGSTDIEILDETVYYYPIDGKNLNVYTNLNLQPFPDRQQFEYSSNNILYYGSSGIPVYYGLDYISGNIGTIAPMTNTYVTGETDWKRLKCKFRTSDNSGKQTIHVGILIETDFGLNQNKPLFINNFTYTGQDILVQNNTNKISLIEDHFNSSYIGSIQKLRIYDKALTSPEVLHNAIMETTNNSTFITKVTKGGRIINK